MSENDNERQLSDCEKHTGVSRAQAKKNTDNRVAPRGAPDDDAPPGGSSLAGRLCVSEPINRVCCPHCRALLFMSRGEWWLAAVGNALVAIKCWRCRRVVALSLEEETWR